MKKERCPKCNHEFSLKAGNFKKHFASCDGSYKPFKKLSACKYCNLDFTGMTSSQRASHSRWCQSNPKRPFYINSNNGLHLHTEAAIKNRIEGIKRAHSAGKYAGVGARSIETRRKNGTLCHTEETKELLRQKALASPHRRLKKKVIDYGGVKLDSSWELALAKRLDELSIKWTRPDPIIWYDSTGESHHYFPDFYLVDFDLYLDPKNEYAFKVQKEKLDLLLVQHTNIKILHSLDECKSFTI